MILKKSPSGNIIVEGIEYAPVKTKARGADSRSSKEWDAMKQKIIACCNECGKEKYPTKRNVYGITVCMGECPFCKKQKLIIPASDWEYMMGRDGAWD
jgi:hypothetical protein